MTIPASSWIQMRASWSRGQLCGLWCFDMPATPGPLGCDPLFCQQLIPVAAIAVAEHSVPEVRRHRVFVKELGTRSLNECVSEGTPEHISYARVIWFVTF